MPASFVRLPAPLALTLALAACGGDHVATTDAGPDAFVAPPAIGNFPAGFLWGTAIAPYQVEGNLHGTDWYQWESLCPDCSGDHADDGPDFWDHYDGDFALAQQISNNSIRLGIEWARIFPTADSFATLTPDAAAVAHYHAILASAHAHGLSVMVTLVHFSLPIYLDDLTQPDTVKGWEDPAIVPAFARWAGWAATEFGADVDLWITLNEPFIQIVGGWVSGSVPPGKKLDLKAAFVAAENMIRAHAAGYDAIHLNDTVDADSDGQAARVSIAQHSRVFVPKDPNNPKQVRAVTMLHYLLNEYFLEAVTHGNIDRNFDMDVTDAGDVADDASLKGRLDFIGLNYYGVTMVLATANDANFPLIGIPLTNDLDQQGFAAPITDFGWSIYPAGLRQVLDELKPYGLPIIITENGIADGGETMRSKFLIEHLYEIGKAIDDGLDVKGYYHWSLIDNFEWTAGYCPKFGLFRVDNASAAKTRTMGEGAMVYKQIIDAKTVDPALFGQYAYGAPGHCVRLGI